VLGAHTLPPQDASPEPRDRSPAAAAAAGGGRDKSPPPTKLHVGKLTRNVTEEHVREIFGHYGALVGCSLAVDPRVSLPKGYAVVEFDAAEDAARAMDYMDGAQLDGNVITCVVCNSVCGGGVFCVCVWAWSQASVDTQRHLVSGVMTPALVAAAAVPSHTAPPRCYHSVAFVLQAKKRPEVQLPARGGAGAPASVGSPRGRQPLTAAERDRERGRGGGAAERDRDWGRDRDRDAARRSGGGGGGGYGDRRRSRSPPRRSGDLDRERGPYRGPGSGGPGGGRYASPPRRGG
jgi:RNA-binding protein with serine-rich domain 1